MDRQMQGHALQWCGHIRMPIRRLNPDHRLHVRLGLAISFIVRYCIKETYRVGKRLVVARIRKSLGCDSNSL